MVADSAIPAKIGTGFASEIALKQRDRAFQASQSSLKTLQNVLDTSSECIAIHGAIQNHGGGHTGQAQCAGECRRLPMPVRNARSAPLTLLGAATNASHLRVETRFIDNDKLFWIKIELGIKPFLTLFQKARAFLLPCMGGFFYM